MQHPGDQTKIHLNPEFISRGRAPLNPKVHVNPAFLQKPQETFAAQNYVTPAIAPTPSNIDHHEWHYQSLASRATCLTTSHMTAGLASRATCLTTSHITAGLASSATCLTTSHMTAGLASSATCLTTSHMTAGLPRIYHKDSTHVHPHKSGSVNGFPVPSSSNSTTKISNLYTVPSSSKTKTCDLYTKSSSTVPSSLKTKSHSSYSKNNMYNPYSKKFSIYAKGLPQTQNNVAKKVVVGKHSSSYSWKASNAKTWTSSNQGDSSTSVAMLGKANLLKFPDFVTQKYTYPNPAMKYSSVNKSFIAATVTRSTGASQKVTPHTENKPAASHSSLHSISYKNKNIPHSSTSPVKITGNMNAVKANPTNPLSEEKCAKVTETKAQVTQVVGQKNPGKIALNTYPSSQINKMKNEKAAPEALPQNTGGKVTKTEFLKVPKSVVSKNIANKSSGGSAPKALSPGTTSKSAQLTPNRKWVSKNKVVNSSYKKPVQTKATNLNNSNNQIALKTPRQKGSYKIITKTKLVRTNSNSTTKGKVQQQQPSSEGQSVAHGSKTTHSILPRVTNLTKTSKSSPALRQHHTNTRLNSKRRYSVLSRTKLVRSQNQPGKGATPGKPKYSVITKNKLVRRRSSSGSGGSKSLSKASDTKAKASKPETERQKRFHVLSKTKIVRRRSSSGVYKASSSPGLAFATPVPLRKKSIVKRHKLVRNVSSTAAKQDTVRFNRRSFPRKVNTLFKVINTPNRISTKQRLAKGIISKYKINRLKVGSLSNYRKYHKYFNYSSKARQKNNKYKFQSKETCASKRSDRFINIGGILYKSTKTSLRKQLPRSNYKAGGKRPDATCTVFLRGEKFRLTAGGKTLQRVVHSQAAKSTLARVHLGGLTYSRTNTGHYELTKIHQARALLSSARHRSVVTLMQKRRKALYQKRNEYCVFFNRFGRCTKKNRGQCPYVHDPSRVAICTRFLRGRCPVNNCPFSHTIDPDKMPVCSHFLQAACVREDCPYRHVKVNPSAPVCLDFVKGHCKAGEECDKQHILICEEFKTGTCPRGASCPLSHRKGRKRPRKVSFSRDSARQASLSVYKKRRRSESLEILGGPVTKRKVEKKKKVEAKSSQQRYFHLVTNEGSPEKDADGLKTSQPGANDEQKVHNEKISSANRTLNPDTSHQDPTETEGQEAEKQEDTEAQTDTEHDGSAKMSLLEETRSRVMKKVDQMKKSHLAHSEGTEEATASYTTGTQEGMSEPGDSHQPSTATKEKPSKCSDPVTVNSSETSTQSCSDAEMLSNTDQASVQRPSLPKRLPSYIPLTLDKD